MRPASARSVSSIPEPGAGRHRRRAQDLWLDQGRAGGSSSPDTHAGLDPQGRRRHPGLLGVAELPAPHPAPAGRLRRSGGAGRPPVLLDEGQMGPDDDPAARTGRWAGKAVPARQEAAVAGSPRSRLSRRPVRAAKRPSRLPGWRERPPRPAPKATRQCLPRTCPTRRSSQAPVWPVGPAPVVRGIGRQPRERRCQRMPRPRLRRRSAGVHLCGGGVAALDGAPTWRCPTGDEGSVRTRTALARLPGRIPVILPVPGPAGTGHPAESAVPGGSPGPTGLRPASGPGPA